MKSRYRFTVLLWGLFCCTSLLQAQWTTFTPMPSARWGVSCTSYGGLLYAISGNGSTANEAFNPGTNTWASLAPVPTQTAYPAVCAWNGKVYVMGGVNGAAWSNLNQIYDISTNTWSAGAVLPGVRMGAAAVAYNGKIYLQGGWDGVLMSSLVIYDIVTNTWSSGAAAPTARYMVQAGAIGNIIYVMGGYTSAPVTTLEAYNTSTNTWQTRAGMTNARYIHAGGSDGTLLHAAGGFPNTGTYETYNPTTNSWTTRLPLNIPRYRVGGALVNGCFYVVGGVSSALALPTIEGFCGWTVLPVAAELHLQASPMQGGVRLFWELPSELADITWQVERSSNGIDFEAIGQTQGTNEWWDLAPFGHQLWYRLTSLDADVAMQRSNVAEVNLGDEPFFLYEQQASRLVFVVAANQGKASLFDVNGRLVFQEQVSGRLEWFLADLPVGVYIFRFENGDGGFLRKVLRM